MPMAANVAATTSDLIAFISGSFFRPSDIFEDSAIGAPSSRGPQAPNARPHSWDDTARERLFLAGAEVVELGLEPAGGWYGPGSRALDQIVGAAEAAAARGLVDERLGRVDHAAADEPVVLGKNVAARGRHVVPAAVAVEAAIGSGDVG